MKTLRIKRKLAALIKGIFEEHLSISLAENSNVPRLQEHYITQFFEEIDGRVTGKISQ